MYNCGMIAAELPAAVLDELFKEFAGSPTTLSVDTEKGTLTFKAQETAGSRSKEKTVTFVLKDFEKALVDSGGWIEYADKHY